MASTSSRRRSGAKVDPRATHAIDYRGPCVIADIDGTWQAVYRLIAQGAEIVVSGVEVRARGGVPPGGLTTGVVRALRPPLALRLFQEELSESLRPGSLASRSEAAGMALLRLGEFSRRLIPPDLTIDEAEAYLRSGSLTPEALAEARAVFDSEEPPGWAEIRNEAKRRWSGWGVALKELQPGSRPTPAERLRRIAETAELYVQARAEGDPAPNRRVAELQGRKPGQVRDDLREARRMELLTGTPGRGRPGGVLTTRAWEILAQQTEPDRSEFGPTTKQGVTRLQVGTPVRRNSFRRTGGSGVSQGDGNSGRDSAP